MEHLDPLDIEAQKQLKADNDLRGRLARETEEDDLRWLMGSKRGRRIVWRLLDLAGVFRSSFNPVAMQMAFNEGFRNYGNRMLAQIHDSCPDFYPQMMKENMSHDRTSSPGSRAQSK